MYLVDLSHPEKANEKLGVTQIIFDQKVDFFIWILIVLGMNFSPFDYHINHLNQNSITIEEWISWLKETIADKDPRWLYKIEDVEAQAQVEIEKYQKLFPIEQTENLDWTSIRANIVARLTWLNEQYRQVSQEYSPHKSKHEFLQDSRLIKMWEVYQSIPKSNHNIEELLNTPTNYLPRGSDSVRKIYLVNYPKLVEYSINISTIIGVPKDPDFSIQLVVDKI